MVLKIESKNSLAIVHKRAEQSLSSYKKVLQGDTTAHNSSEQSVT